MKRRIALVIALAAVVTGTMPQGIALSPDQKRLAVVESGAGPAAAASARMDWRDPDAVDADTLNDILAHAVGKK